LDGPVFLYNNRHNDDARFALLLGLYCALQDSEELGFIYAILTSLYLSCYDDSITGIIMDTQNTIKMRFLDVFNEDKDETLTLKIDLRVKGEDFRTGQSFRKNEKIGVMDFHLLRYFDLALNPMENNIYDVTGFFPQK